MMKITVIFLLVFGNSAFWVGDPDFETYNRGYNAIVAENWQEAITTFEQLLANHPESRWADNASFWKCYADRQVDPDDERDFECYDRVVTEFPDSRWASEARDKQRHLAEQLAEQGREEYLAMVEEAEVSNEHDHVSLEALAALERRGVKASPSTLVELYEKDTSIIVKRQILENLARQENAEDELYQLLLTEHNSALFRQGVLLIPGNYEPQLAWEFLRSLYEDRTDDTFRLSILKAMYEIYDQVEIEEDFLQQLQIVMKGDHGRKAQLATSIVTSAGSPDVRQLKEVIRNPDVHSQTRLTALNLLKDQQSGELPDLFEDLIEQRDAHIFSNYIDMLLEQNLKNPQEILDRILQFEDERYIALRAFIRSQRENPELAEKWIELALTDEYGDQVSGEAVEGVHKTGTVDDLLIVLKESESNIARRRALGLIQSMEEELDLDLLIEVINAQKDVSLKGETLHLFEQDERNGVVPFLVEIANESDHAHVRRQAVTVLGTIDTDEATQALLDLM